jgi:hypothetical protein
MYASCFQQTCLVGFPKSPNRPTELVLSYNRNDSDVMRRISWWVRNKLVGKNREVTMENVSRYRAMGSICRQRAVFDPQNSWKHLGDAERWEHLAAVEISAHYNACNTAGSSVTAEPGATPRPNDKPWRTDAAA